MERQRKIEVESLRHQPAAGGHDDGAVPGRDLRQVGLLRRESSGGTLDIWLLDIATRQMRRVTFTNTPSSMTCAFSPDGQRLAVSSA